MFLPISASGAFGCHSFWATPTSLHTCQCDTQAHRTEHLLPFTQRTTSFTDHCCTLLGEGSGENWKLDSKLWIPSASVRSWGMIRDHWSRSLWASSGFTCFFSFVLWTEVLCRVQQGKVFPAVEGENAPAFLILNKPKFSSAVCALCSGFR